MTVAMEGRRALVTEVQALIGAAVSGLAAAYRLRPRLAPGWRWCWPCCSAAPKELTLHDREVFAATVGGIRVVEPAADLAMALAVASGGLNLAISPRLAAIGEVGLTGEVRRVGAVPRRLAEAARLGFRYALVPPGCGPAASGVDSRHARSPRWPTCGSALRCAAQFSAE